ncbi:hypothetical protein EWM64_g1932 [Hericium alpestre]|uniref:NADP-dependent oxidoreductase domain-containing protein n=1 Tax=Hericium alpestre TaxID=135208 RepID=A0A4Z0A4V8_9AGAM|nr:hypothetical protein EWM64_g1932 [Hericium alpestre]
MATVVLKSGQKMPLVGFGLWKVTKDQCADTVYNAIKSGYRLLDGAGDYGNEKQAGEGVARAIKDGIVKREELFITSKLWNTFHQHDHVSSIYDLYRDATTHLYGQAKAAAKMQLSHWGLDYFDLFLIHFPISLQYVDPKHRYPPEWFDDNGKVQLQNTPYQETWKALEELVNEGLAKNIGVSNVAGALLLDVFRYARIQPSVLQIELHPYLTQQPIVKLAKVLGIAVTAYSSFGPQGYYELGHAGTKSLLEQEPAVQAAQAHNKTPAQVLLRWATQRGIAVVPKSNNHSRLVENLDSVSFNLTDEQLAKISALNINLRASPSSNFI